MNKQTSSKPKITIYTDGSCLGNPGPGGWGALLFWNDEEKEISGGEVRTTNNRMELTATIKALQILKRKSSVTLYTDSTYVRNGITSWINDWKRAGWKRRTGPVKNIDLWKELDELNSLHEVSWVWVKGHSGNELNDRVDELARKAVPGGAT